jgi:hypothetical protein
MNGWKVAGGGCGGSSVVVGLICTCGVWGLVMTVALAVLVLVIAVCAIRWVLSDDDRTKRLVAVRSSTALPPGGGVPRGPAP